MKINITEKKENLLLKRMELKGRLTFEGATPSNKDLAEELVKSTKAEADCLVVKHLYTDFSHQEGRFEALVYKDKQSRDKTEPTTSSQRKKAEEEKKKAAEAAGSTGG